MRVLAPLVAFCLCFAGYSLSPTGAATVQTQTISGRVIDPAKQGIPGAVVELRQGDAVQRRTTTDTRGDFRFDAVAAGDYRVRAMLAGFVTTEAIVSVGTEEPKPLLVTMKVGASRRPSSS